MNRKQKDNIWEKTDILINNFKRYDLEKRIQYVAKNAVNLELNNLQARRMLDDENIAVHELNNKNEEKQKETKRKIVVNLNKKKIKVKIHEQNAIKQYKT